MISDRAKMRSTITLQLIVLITTGIIVLWCGAATYSTLIAYKELNEAFDQTLQEAARRLLPLAADDVLGRESDDTRAIHRFLQGRREYLSYQLTDASGRIVLRTHDAPSGPYRQAANPGFSTVGDYRLFTDTDETTGLTITVAETNDSRYEAVFGVVRSMLWPLAGLIPLNIFGVWLAVRRAMEPVQRLSRDIAVRGGTNLAPLDISDQPSELRPIAEAVARLLERLRAALDAERAFAANSAHELRTPIAGALARTQRMIAELSDPADRRRARDVEATLKRLSGLAEKLMQLSRVDAGVGLGDKDVDLIPVLDLVVDDCARMLGYSERIRYFKPEGATLIARIDMDAFAIVVRNLIDNAATHGDSDGLIEVQVEPDGTIRTINQGRIVPSAMLAGLKRRFVRGETRGAGSGLGLAIAETIMTQTGGKLELFSPAPGRQDGFEARIFLGKETSAASPVEASSGLPVRQAESGRGTRAREGY